MTSKPLCIGLAVSILLLVSSVGQAQQKKFAEGKPFVFVPRPSPTPVTNGAHATFRTYDGTNNNIRPQQAEWGATDVPLLREQPSDYGASDPKNAMSGANRPSARKLSNVLCDEPTTVFNGRNLDAFIYVWGQFLDHDITLTPTGTTEYAPVLLPADEPLFTVPVPFYRSEVRLGTGTTTPRQQSNLNTAWVDGSVVYGCDATRAAWLRTGKNGKLKTSAGNLLPWNTTTGEQSAPIDPTAPSMSNDQDHTIKTFVAGDVRAAEHPGITSLHTVFVREHNRICDRLLAQGLKNDEEIFQKARKEVGALIQAVTYQEFLPAMGVTLAPYQTYRDNVQPDILNTFATASYRIGHTMVADELSMRDNNCNKVGTGVLELDEAFWDPQIVATYGTDSFLKGFSTHKAYETNLKINSVLRNVLFGSKAAAVRFGLDLASLNIQRGRDHGLPSYNTVKGFYTGRVVVNFSQITSNTAVAASLQSLYGNVNNVDLWVGLLAEDLLPGKSVGQTMHAMLKVQFERLRDGDFYFYKNDPALPANIRDQVSATTLSDVIKRNTGLTTLASTIFFLNTCPGENGQVASTPKNSVTNITSTGAKEGVTTVTSANTEDPATVETITVNIYPNPAQTVLNVDMDSQPISRLVRIISLNGNVLRQVDTAPNQTHLLLPITDLRDGLYLLKVSNGQQIKTVRFLKMSN